MVGFVPLSLVSFLSQSSLDGGFVGGYGVVIVVVVLFLFLFFFFYVMLWPPKWSGGCGRWWWWWLWVRLSVWLMVKVVMVGAVDVFLDSGIYYFIVGGILFSCDIYITLFC